MLTLENYHSREMNIKYLGSTQYKDFCGSYGILGCEAKALAKLSGAWEEKPTPAMVMSSYVDAHFAGNLHVFQAKNADIFTKTGTLKAQFVHAEEIIKRIERDEYFMKFMSGEKQKIMTAEWLGCKWKIAIDSYIKDVAIVDLKVMKALSNAHWIKDYGYMSFVEYYGYDIQAAIYQKIVEINTGKRLPVFIAGASKEAEPDIEIIGIDNNTIRNAQIEIEENIDRILKLRRWEIKPDRCGVCDYCKYTKVLKAPVHYSQLINQI